MKRTVPAFDRITVDPGQLGGKPCIRGMRISVQRVLEILAENPSWEEILADYPGLEAEDIVQQVGIPDPVEPGRPPCRPAAGSSGDRRGGAHLDARRGGRAPAKNR
jgi:uncharacterized protein (DUF433 family)